MRLLPTLNNYLNNSNLMKILCIGDTHGFHEDLRIPEEIDMIIHNGDIANNRAPSINSNECALFLNWYNQLNIKYKVLIAGNHDTAIEAKLIDPKDFKSIIYLCHESTNIEGINIFGSPYTPEFYQWAFNIKRSKIDEYWKEIPENLDILVTHGPPKGILDLGEDKQDNNKPEFCGDKALLNHIERTKPHYHLFGHIHDNGACYNKGIRKLPNNSTTFINTSCVTDNKFNLGLTSQGIIITL